MKLKLARGRMKMREQAWKCRRNKGISSREVPNVTECYRITGEDCYFLKVYLRSIEDLEPILDLFTPHGRTTTSIVHSAPVPPRPLPVPGPG